jgi:DNA ligase-1
VVEEDELKTWPAEKWAKYQLEPKYDGARLIYMRGKFFSRSGKSSLNNLDHIKKALDEIPGIENVVLDGELHGKDWNDTMHLSRAKDGERDGSSLVFHVFDMMGISDFEKQDCPLTLGQRQDYAVDLVYCSQRSSFQYVKVVQPEQVTNYEEFKQYYAHCLNTGCDGVVLKERDSLYAFKRSKTWLKVKPILTADCEIVGMVEGKGKYAGVLGALEIRPEGSTMTTMCSGMTDKERKGFWLHECRYIGQTVEVKYRGVHKSGRLIEPRFVRMRPDKEKVA